MDEIKKSVRFVIPGLIFIMELALFLLFSHEHRKWVKENFQAFSGSATTLIGAAVTALFASGGIGYLLSSLNHVILTPLFFSYQGFLTELLDAKLIRAVDKTDK